MKNSTKLMEQRGALVEELETLLNSVASEERDFTEEENEKQDSFHEQIADLDNAIQRAKNNEAVFAAAAGTASSQSEAKEVVRFAASSASPRPFRTSPTRENCKVSKLRWPKKAALNWPKLVRVREAT